MTLVTIPQIGHREDVTETAVKYVFDSAALIYVISWPANGEPNLDKVLS